MIAWGKDVLVLFRATGDLARRRLGWVALAALAPFAISHLVVLQARRIGLPERLALDLVHGLFVLSYLTACVRVAQGRAYALARFGFALPKPSWPGFGVMARVVVVVVVVGLPVALLLHPFVQMLERMQTGAGLYIPVTMLPEFVMTTLVGLALAASMDQEKHDH